MCLSVFVHVPTSENAAGPLFLFLFLFLCVYIYIYLFMHMNTYCIYNAYKSIQQKGKKKCLPKALVITNTNIYT